jgi:hypothetical protein
MSFLWQGVLYLTNLAEALPYEIDRVRKLQDEYKSLRGLTRVIIEPQIAMMEAEIQAAIKACAEGDVVEMVRSCQSLREWES